MRLDSRTRYCPFQLGVPVREFARASFPLFALASTRCPKSTSEVSSCPLRNGRMDAEFCSITASHIEHQGEEKVPSVGCAIPIGDENTTVSIETQSSFASLEQCLLAIAFFYCMVVSNKIEITMSY